MSCAESELTAGVTPEIVAAISAALAAYGYSADQGYQITNVTKCSNPWRKAGIIEIMLGRELNRDFS